MGRIRLSTCFRITMKNFIKYLTLAIAIGVFVSSFFVERKPDTYCAWVKCNDNIVKITVDNLDTMQMLLIKSENNVLFLNPNKLAFEPKSEHTKPCQIVKSENNHDGRHGGNNFAVSMVLLLVWVVVFYSKEDKMYNYE